jgi:hypothetical protein
LIRRGNIIQKIDGENIMALDIELEVPKKLKSKTASVLIPPLQKKRP